MHTRKNGFTLIELLVTIALIISVFTLAITNIVKISKKQKENAFEKVKEQIEVAAEQYFTSNEYLFEGLNKDGFGIITVGKLVEDDYLNKLTNPITGMPLNECDKVKVQRDADGKYNISYLGAYDEYCFASDGILLKSNGDAPDIELEFVDNEDLNTIDKGDDNWINEIELKANSYEASAVFVKITTKADIADMQYCETTADKCNETNLKDFWDGMLRQLSHDEEDIKIDEGSFSSDTSEKKVCYIAKNSYGFASMCIKAGVDTKEPNVKVEMYNNDKFLETEKYNEKKGKKDNWVTHDVYYEYKADDIDENGSGLYTIQDFWNLSGLTKSDAEDSKNKWHETKQYYKSNKNGTSGIANVSGYEIQGQGHFSAEGVRKIRYVVCDVAGNCNSDVEKTAYIDKTAPSLKFTKDKFSGKNVWNNDDKRTYKIEVSDALSGMDFAHMYWNSPNLTETVAKSDEYSWKNNSYKGGGDMEISVSTEPGVITEYEGKLNEQGYRKYKYILRDNAGNSTSTERIDKLDSEAPKVVKSGSGPVRCKRNGSSGENAHGYSVEVQDNLSGTTIDLFQYYSDGNCSNGSFKWHSSPAQKSVAENGKTIFTALAGCENNPAPGARFKLIDGAGNEYKDLNGNKYLEVTHSKSEYNVANDNECSSDVWFDLSPNRK